jgi:hypothetical protein
LFTSNIDPHLFKEPYTMIGILTRAALLLPLASVPAASASEDAGRRHGSDHGYGHASVSEGRWEPRREWRHGSHDHGHSHRRHLREED